MEIKYNLSNDQDRENTKEQLLQLLNEYLKFIGDDIADSVYSFFKPYHLEGPTVYSNAAANALYMFASKRKARSIMKEIGDDDYYILCDMLKNVILFCNNIISREANLVRLDKSKFESRDTSHIHLTILLSEKMMYEHKLKELRETRKMCSEF